MNEPRSSRIITVRPRWRGADHLSLILSASMMFLLLVLLVISGAA